MNDLAKRAQRYAGRKTVVRQSKAYTDRANREQGFIDGYKAGIRDYRNGTERWPGKLKNSMAKMRGYLT